MPDGEIDAARRIVRLREELLMMYTSGTTAAPKGCPFGHEAVVRAALAIVDRFELTGEDRFWTHFRFTTWQGCCC